MVNIVSPTLCDDIIARLAPSLERHKGCDIIDLNPANALFSSKLHKHLKPRTHILMEPDKKYQPFLKPLLNPKNSRYKLLASSDFETEITSKEFYKKYLPNQELLPLGDPRRSQINNSLLFVANIGRFRGRQISTFKSYANMLLFKLFSNIQTQSYFQAHGLVRMLIWINDSDKDAVLPRIISGRKRFTSHAEKSCDVIEEVAGLDRVDSKFTRKRERALDIESALNVDSLMKKNGIKTPETRKSRLQREIANGISEIYPDPAESDQVRRPSIDRKWHSELELLEKQLDQEKFTSFTVGPEGSPPKRTPQYNRLVLLRAVRTSENKAWSKANAIIREDTELEKLAFDPSEESQLSYKSRLKHHREKFDSCHDKEKSAIVAMMDDRKAMSMDPPLLLWDRRTYEPLIVQRDEFSPKQPLCLLDFHPSTNILAPSQQSKALDPADFIPHFIFSYPSCSIIEGLNRIAPGAAEALIPQIPSLHDPAKGGRKDLNFLHNRMLTPQMIGELVLAWEAWPDKPSDAELWAKMGKYNELFTSDP